MLPDFSSRLSQGLLLLGLCGTIHAEILEIGQPAPEFELSDPQGRIHRLADYVGQWVVLFFYPLDDSPGCTTEACAFRDEYQLIHHQNAQVLGVSMNSSDSQKQFAEKFHLPFPLLSDPKGQVVARYGAMGGFLWIRLPKRHTFLIDPEGKIRNLWRKVDPRGHAKEITQLLHDYQQGP